MRWLLVALGLGLVLTAAPTLASRPDQDRAAALAAKIDAALGEAHRKEGVVPAPAVADLELYRRLSLDLLGTIPSLEEVRAFEAEPAEGRRDRLIARLLADPRFHEAFAERLARIVVGAGTIADDLFYRRRRFVAWLEREVSRRRPWDEIVRELLAIEGVTVDGPANFIAAADADANKLAARTARAFLGVRLDCAQCHDHPFADWKQRDFEGLAAFFARTRRDGPVVHEAAEGELELEGRMDGKPRPVAPRFPFAREIVPITSETLAPGRRHAVARWLTARENPWFARAVANRIWAWLMGRGLVDPVDELDQRKPRLPELLALLEADLRENGFDLERLVRAIVSTQAYARSSRVPEGGDEERLEALHAVYPLKPLHPDQLANALWQATSLWTQDGRRTLLLRVARLAQTNDFIGRHGGTLDAEEPEDETLLQRLLLLNGDLLHERIKWDDPFRPTQRLRLLTPDHETAIEVAYLMVLTRRPTPEERDHFRERLRNRTEQERAQAIEDMLWALVNSVEFGWNH